MCVCIYFVCFSLTLVANLAIFIPHTLRIIILITITTTIIITIIIIIIINNHNNNNNRIDAAEKEKSLSCGESSANAG